MKRFWDIAESAPQGDGLHAVLLDGRPMRLPGEAAFAVPGRALADAVAAEWQAAGGARDGEFTAEDIPLTRLAATGVARIAPDPAPTIAGLAGYAETDLLCYRATISRLAERQTAAWQPLLDWAERAFGARLVVTEGVMPVPQPAASLKALRQALGGLSPLALAALGLAVPVLGSLVLGLALAHGRLDAETAFTLSVLDELDQEAVWGADAEAQASRARRAGDVALAARLLSLLDRG
ncbi:ATP12 family chaperone protein [Plastoroseomonas arctica]|uniref:Chaperone, ATP12 n=1 Tax=Plastoroseomonas arctica TaxID=1509237 RepID=A0AAF1K051_9PROT|nr:ATP12 family protein [Plastoroseomonas arctica]MBR0656453.1 chaperone, ATP12 [Plastoroseomonas arctica]